MENGQVCLSFLPLSYMDLFGVELASARSVTAINKTRIRSLDSFSFTKFKNNFALFFVTDLETKMPNSLELSGQPWFLGFLLLFLCPFSLYFCYQTGSCLLVVPS